MKLALRFIFIPVFLAAFSYLFYSAYKDVKDRTLAEFNTQQLTLAKQASRGIESFFIYYKRELLFLSKLKYVSELDDVGKDLLADFYKNHSDQIEAITIVSEKGILLYTFPFNKMVIGQDISNQEHVKTVIKTHEPVVSDVFTAVQGYRAIAYHIPIMDGDKFKGSIGILIPVSRLGQRFVENIKTGVTGYGWMVSKDSVILYSPLKGQSGKSLREVFGKSYSINELVDKTLQDSEGITIYNNTAGTGSGKGMAKTITAFYRVTLGNTFWTIIIFTPEKEVFATFKSFRDRLFILIALITIVLTTYFYLTLKADRILKEDKKRKALENVLRESEKRFRVMFELSPAGIILIDQKGAIIEVNAAFCEALGYTREELISKNIRLFSSPSRKDEIEKNIEKILAGNTLKHEVTNFRKDGTTCEIALYETMILLPDGKPGILSVSDDITERKRINKELVISKERAEESDKLKSTFLTNMSHELRTPLNAIIGFASFMAETAKDEETASYSKIIFDSGQHLLRLVEDILDTSMIEIGQLKIKNEKVEIISLLNEVKNIITGERLRENKTNVDIILRTDKEVLQKIIITDSRKLKQVLINLLKNALKYTDAGYIEFGFNEIEKSDARFLKFYVKDTGIGIDRKYHKVIFNVFRQVDDTYSRKHGGAGIGLSIVKSIVEMLKGEIWVESEPGKGSNFIFIIPEITENIRSESGISDKGSVSENTFKGKTILIVEDENSNFEFLRIFLSRMNINVLLARDGLEAINLCEIDPSINLVLMDIKIPLLNGLDATRKIKEKHPGLPVIAQTSYALATDKDEAINAGCDDYLSKPIEIDRLRELLKKYLS